MMGTRVRHWWQLMIIKTKPEIRQCRVWNACNGNEVSFWFTQASDVAGHCPLPPSPCHLQSKDIRNCCQVTAHCVSESSPLETWHAYLVATTNLITHDQKRRPLQESGKLGVGVGDGRAAGSSVQIFHRITVHLWPGFIMAWLGRVFTSAGTSIYTEHSLRESARRLPVDSSLCISIRIGEAWAKWSLEN